MKKVLLTATVQSHICQFHLPLVKMLKEKGYRVDVAARNNLDVKPGLELKNVDKVYDVPFSRSPYSKDNIKAYAKLKKIINENGYDIIHCNTPMGAAVTRLAAKKNRKKGTKVIYTAHGFHFYKGSPKMNWILYYPIEKLLSYKTDMLICINKEDYNLAKKSFHAKNTGYIHGVGFDKNRFDGRISKEEAREKLGIKDGETVLLSVGDLCERKNHKVIVKALSAVKNTNCRLYIAGWDMLDGKLAELAESLEVADKVTFLGYTRQLSLYFSAADIYLFPSLQEGLPIALIEAMSQSLPVIATNIRGTNDLITDGDGGYLLTTDDYEGFAEKIEYLSAREDLRRKFGERNAAESQKYEVTPVIKEIETLYEALIQGDKKQ